MVLEKIFVVSLFLVAAGHVTLAHAGDAIGAGPEETQGSQVTLSENSQAQLAPAVPHEITKIFSGKASKIGESFVCMWAYDQASDAAAREGFSCNRLYKAWISTSFFNSSRYTCKVEVECSSRNSN